MKKSPYSPDEFMSGLYGRLKADPYKDADSYEAAVRIGKNIKENYKITVANETDGKIFIDEVIGETNLKAVLPIGAAIILVLIIILELI